jgi:hypothetical protein
MPSQSCPDKPIVLFTIAKVIGDRNHLLGMEGFMKPIAALAAVAIVMMGGGLAQAKSKSQPIDIDTKKYSGGRSTTTSTTVTPTRPASDSSSRPYGNYSSTTSDSPAPGTSYDRSIGAGWQFRF